MKKLLLAAVAAAAVAVPAAPASADCMNVVSVLGANSVSLCSHRVWEKTYIYYGCSLDTNFDGRPEAVCDPLFMIELYG